MPALSLDERSCARTLEEGLEERPVATGRIHAGRRAEQGDFLPRTEFFPERREQLVPLAHLGEIPLPVLPPPDRRAVLSVEVRVQLAARAQIRHPDIPGLVLFADPARPVPADEHAQALPPSGRVVPA